MIRGILALLCIASALDADPGPGDIFREFLWRPIGWQRVTDPEAGDPRAKEFPNRVNGVKIDDLQGATRAEVYIEMWGGHAGTSGKRLRLNGGDWITIPDPVNFPGDAGRVADQDPTCYQHFTYPSIPVPLEQLQEGNNRFEFTSGGQICFNFGWGQWGAYGVTFRIYYDESKPHPIGRVTAPEAGSAIADSVRLQAEASSPNGKIEQVDFIGLYEDFDYEGNGLYRQWHYRYRYGKIKNHLGTATDSSYAVTWNTTWVPDQEEPMFIMARIKDESGLYYMTPAVAGLEFERPGTSVKLYKPFDVPPKWQTRTGHTQGSKVFVPQDLERAEAARMVLTTWNGISANAIGINDSDVVAGPGRDHDYSYNEIPVPLDYVRPGTNILYTFDTTEHHGIEVLWPGIALLVRYTGIDADLPLRPSADLPIFADELATTWRLDLPQDGELAESQDAYSGHTALAVQPSSTFFWIIDVTASQPVAADGYRAVRLALRLEKSVKSWHWLKLLVNGQAVDVLAREQGHFGFVAEEREWQIIEVPLEAFSMRFPYVETLRFEGRLDGALLLDDVRLVVAVDSPTDVAERRDAILPANFLLRQNFPNPFNSSTTLQFDLPQDGAVDLSIYNLSGQKMATLAQGHLAAGMHTLQWDGRDARGRELASGVYFYRLRTESQTQSRRLVLLR